MASEPFDYNTGAPPVYIRDLQGSPYHKFSVYVYTIKLHENFGKVGITHILGAPLEFFLAVGSSGSSGKLMGLSNYLQAGVHTGPTD